MTPWLKMNDRTRQRAIDAWLHSGRSQISANVRKRTGGAKGNPSIDARGAHRSC